MTVYVAAFDDTDFAVSRYTALAGFAQMGERVETFEPDAFDDVPLAAEDIVVGGIGFAHRAFKRLGIPIPALPIMPKSLIPHADRRLWQAPMAEIRQRVQAGEAVFAKPRPERHKLFGGTRLQTMQDLIATAAVPDDEIVACSDIVDFVAEYRCFVLHGEIIGLRHYKGDPLTFPDADTVRAMVKAYDPAPASYALDVGKTSDGRTLVVEVNDGYSSGAYGLAPLRFAKLIAARWAELRGLAP